MSGRTWEQNVTDLLEQMEMFGETVMADPKQRLRLVAYTVQATAVLHKILAGGMVTDYDANGIAIVLRVVPEEVQALAAQLVSGPAPSR